MLEQILANDMIFDAINSVAVIALTAIVAFVVKKINFYLQDTENKQFVEEVFNEAVWDTYETFVKEIKASKSDGKLTKAEAKAAMDKSVAKVTEIAKRRGVDLLKEFGLPAIHRLIENTIQKFKHGGATS